MRHLAMIVCGSRHWTDVDTIHAALDGLAGAVDFVTLIEGAAPGADSIAANWAEYEPKVRHIPVPAFWKLHGKKAGPLRNEEMLWLLDDMQATAKLVLAFKESFALDMRSGGTENMVSKAVDALLPTSVLGANGLVTYRWNYGDDLGSGPVACL